MRHMKIIKGLLVVLFTLGLSACSGTVNKETAQPGETLELTPYHTATLTPTVTPTPTGLPTSTPQPSATPTPRVYKVQNNDTMIGIANYFGLTLAELQAANPGVQPALLSIGTELIIPVIEAVALTPTVAAPVAYAINLLETACTPSLTGGYHCYALVENEEDFTLENLTAEIMLSDPAGGEPISRVVELPLQQLPAGARLPFYTYFIPPLFADAQPSADILTVTKASNEDVKVFPLLIEEADVSIAADGASASVSGRARLAAEGNTTGSYTLVAVAYNAEGQVIGLRRINGESSWGDTTEVEFTLIVYSTGGKIDRVEVFGEAE